MEYSNNRCGCMQRPQLPEPPHINTGNSCGCAVQRPMQPDMPAQSRNSASPAERPSCSLRQPNCETTQRDCLSDMSVAMAYVPMQRWNQVYDMSRGLTRGTIFPELDLPFVMGRCR